MRQQTERTIAMVLRKAWRSQLQQKASLAMIMLVSRGSLPDPMHHMITGLIPYRHCVDANGNTVEGSCSRPERDYNVGLRVGLLFVILVTSALGVLAPILTSRFTSLNQDHIVIVAMRQFGTGIIISTAIVHVSLVTRPAYFRSMIS